jgi:ubiquinone/menaquinone biosynthesis C-methylase UbiE
MAKSQLRILTEEYWRSFALTAEELDHLHRLILDVDIPQTEAFLAYDLVERRCEQEEGCVEEEAVEVLPYDPRQEYKVGQEIVVKDYRKQEIIYLHGTITGKRDLWMSSLGQCQAIRVRVGEGKSTTSKEYVACARRGFDGWKPIPVEQVVGKDWGLGQTDEYIVPGEVFEQFQGYVLRTLTRQLGADARFIGFGHEWFVPELLALVSEDELAAAARRIKQMGDPLPLHRLTPVPEMPQRNEEFVQQFSWNDALSHDPRFDNVGTADTPLWFLRALEPPETVEKPPRLTIPAMPYTREYEYVHRELKDMEQAIDDEGSEGEAPPPVTTERVPSVEFVLSFAHRAMGTIPLTNRIRRAFPQADGPRTCITFIDGRSRERMPGWVMHEDRYAWGLREWYDENLIWAGAYIRLETTENPLEMMVDYIPLSQPKEEQVRVARVVDGRLTFKWQTRTIPYKYDPLMLIAETRFEDMEALWLEAEKVGKPIFEVMCGVFPELARLHPQGHVHARTLYSAVNLVRRCAPGTVFGELSARPCFDSVGDGCWTYDPDLQDVKVVYRTEREVEQREKRGTWYNEAKRQAAARKAAETRRERGAEPEAAPETPLAEETTKVLEAASEGRPPAPPAETAEPPTAEELPVSEPTPEEPAPPPPEPPTPPTEPTEPPTAEEMPMAEPVPEELEPPPLEQPATPTEPVELPTAEEVSDIGIRHVVYPIPFPGGELSEHLFEEPAWHKLFGEEQLGLWQRTWTHEDLDEALMRLIADKKANRFVTPRQIVDFMVNLAQPKPSERVADICCGTGIFLVKALRFVKEAYGENADLELYGADVYDKAVEAARLNLLANGAQNFTVVQADSLQEQEGIFDAKYDLVLGNPPFGRGKARAFLKRWLELLRDKGRMVVNTSEGTLSNVSRAEFRKWLIRHFEIDMVTSFPFPPDHDRHGAKSNAIMLRKTSVSLSHRTILIGTTNYRQLYQVLDVLGKGINP